MNKVLHFSAGRLGVKIYFPVVAGLLGVLAGCGPGSSEATVTLGTSALLTGRIEKWVYGSGQSLSGRVGGLAVGIAPVEDDGSFHLVIAQPQTSSLVSFKSTLAVGCDGQVIIVPSDAGVGALALSVTVGGGTRQVALQTAEAPDVGVSATALMYADRGTTVRGGVTCKSSKFTVTNQVDASFVSGWNTYVGTYTMLAADGLASTTHDVDAACRLKVLSAITQTSYRFRRFTYGFYENARVRGRQRLAGLVVDVRRLLIEPARKL